MNLVSLAQQIAEAADQRIIFDQGACLLSLDKYSECTACFEICPAMAIQPGSPPTFDEEFCQSCQACLPVCPTSAYSYSGIDTVNALANSIIRQNLKNCDLSCRLNPNFEHGPGHSNAGLRIKGCLAGLGLGGYLTLMSQGLERLFVRVDACDDCPWSMLRAQIDEQVEHAQRLLDLWGRDGALIMVEKLDESKPAPRPFWNAESPPRSRRELVRSKPLADAGDFVGSEGFRERLRVVRGVKDLLAEPGPGGGTTSLEDMDFGLVSVSAECTACGTCGRACPTGALNFVIERSRFSLTFTPEACIGCGICEHVCTPQAVTINHVPTFDQVFGGESSQLLQEGDLLRCKKCRAPFAARLGTQFCPVCEFRRNNPFGSVLPPAVLKRREERRTTG